MVNRNGALQRANVAGPSQRPKRLAVSWRSTSSLRRSSSNFPPQRVSGIVIFSRPVCQGEIAAQPDSPRACRLENGSLEGSSRWALSHPEHTGFPLRAISPPFTSFLTAAAAIGWSGGDGCLTSTEPAHFSRPAARSRSRNAPGLNTSSP